jgi:hypothetical protein
MTLGPHQVEVGGVRVAEPAERVLALVHAADPQREDPEHGLVVQPLGHELLGRRHQQHGPGAQLVPSRLGEIMPRAQHVPRPVDAVADEAAVQDRPDRVQPELERRDHAEVAAPAADAERQILVLVLAGK